MAEPADLLSSLLTDAPADPWAALLARAGHGWLQAGLAHGEYLDGLHVDASDGQAEVRRLAADTAAVWPRTFRSGDWLLVADQHPSGGCFVCLKGPGDAVLVVGAASWPLSPGVWVHVAIETLPEAVRLRLTDSTTVTLQRSRD